MKLYRGSPRTGNAALRRGVLLGLLAAALAMYWYVEYRLASVSVVRLPSGRIFLMEDPRHPALQRLRADEGIDRVVAPAGDELGRLQALAVWTSRLFPATSPFPDYPPWDAAELLRQIRAGETGGFCAQYAMVFAQGCQSLGYQVRYCDLAAPDRRTSHFVPEVYLPSRRRWVVFEPQYGFTYRDELGAPLGVLDLHDIQTGRRAASVFVAPTGVPAASERLELYQHYRFYQRNNFLSVPAFYAVRVVSEGLQFLFEDYRAPCSPREKGSEPARRSELDFIPDIGGADRAVAFSVGSFLAIACGAEPDRVTRIRAPARVLEGVVREMLVRDLEYHPLDGDRSWWPVPRSRLLLPGSNGPARPSASGP